MAVHPRPLSSQLSDVWTRLDRGQRFNTVALLLLSLVIVASLAYFMSRVEYELLYRDLNPEDAQAIAAKLKEEKRDFIVQGTSILVAGPTNEVDKLRLEIAGSGLARSGRVGYEIFDKSPFGMTDFTEQVNLQRALEGELARTISSLSEISQARVHIVLPKDSIFQERREEAKASVAVRLGNGSELSKSSLSGIKGLVSGAVPGLKPFNVSVVDEEGRLLSRSIGSGDDARSELESGVREQLEKDLVQKVISILEPVVGKGKVHANASLDIDFNSTEQTEETYNPNPPVILSQQKTEERVGSSAVPSGIPGTQSNVAGGAGPQPPGATSDRLRQSEITNYEVNKLVRHTIQPKGALRRLSMAVILDHKTVYAKGEDGKVVASSQPRTSQELEAYRELVLAAVGFDRERGDTVTIENVPFYADDRPEETLAPLVWYVRWQPYLLPAMKYISFIMLFFLAWLLLFRPIRKRMLQAPPAAPPALTASDFAEIEREAPPRALSSPAVTEEVPIGMHTETAPAPPPPRPTRREEDLLDLEAFDDQIERDILKEAQSMDLGGRKYAILKKKLTERAKKEPEMVSQLVRSWIQER